MPELFLYDIREASNSSDLTSTSRWRTLLQAQETVHRLNENPVMHLLRCLLNVQFEKNFYPRLDIEKLYKILTTDSALELMQPQLAG